MRMDTSRNRAAGLSVRQSEALMAAVIVARSTSFVFSRMAINSMSPFNILAVRFLTAFAVLLVLFAGRLRRLNRRVLRNGVILGATCEAMMAFEMLGIRYAETSLASLIENAAFILVPVPEILLLGVYPTKAAVKGMALAFLGLLVLGTGMTGGIGRGGPYLLLAMACYAGTIFETSVFAKEGEPLLVGIVQMGTMGTLSLLLTLGFERFRLPQTGAEWAMILMLAVVCSVFGFTLQPVAQRGLTASRAGMFSVLNPLAAMLWGYLVLGERITPVKALGAALIVAGLLLPAAADAKAEDGR